MTERELEKRCREIVRAHGGMVRKLDVGVGSRGWFDAAIYLPGGIHMLVEFKAPGKKNMLGTSGLTRMQRWRRDKLAEMWHTVHIVRSEADMLNLVKNMPRFDYGLRQ